jgi:glutathione S-transferase
MLIYGDSKSGNCLKVKWAADRLGLPYTWREVDILKGESRTPAFLAMNPAGQVPAVVFEDGRMLAQSNAIVLHLAEGSDLIPADAFDRAKMFEWLFWEQYSHEPAIAVARFQLRYLGRQMSDLEPKLIEKGHSALAVMEQALSQRDYFVGAQLSCADIALVAYTRVAHEGGFDLTPYPSVTAWIERVERDLAISS